MAVDALTAYTSLLPYLVAFGLLLDILGAIMVLGPEVGWIARFWTLSDRRGLRRIIRELERGETVTSERRGFDHLRVAVGQHYSEGDTDLPAKPGRVDESLSFNWQFDIVEPHEDHLEFKNIEETRSFTDTIQDLKHHVENYTGTDQLYYNTGLYVFISGFFLQLVGQLANIDETLSLAVFLVGGTAISVFGWRFRYTYSMVSLPSSGDR